LNRRQRLGLVERLKAILSEDDLCGVDLQDALETIGLLAEDLRSTRPRYFSGLQRLLLA